MAQAVVTVQRDLGNRINRHQARLEYTIERIGVDAFRAEVEKRAGIQFLAPRPVSFRRRL